MEECVVIQRELTYLDRMDNDRAPKLSLLSAPKGYKDIRKAIRRLF
jgi:hypothetical protein